MWDLDDWKDFAEVVKNVSETIFMVVAALAVLKWASRSRN